MLPRSFAGSFLEKGLDGLDTYHPGQKATVLTPALRPGFCRPPARNPAPSLLTPSALAMLRHSCIGSGKKWARNPTAWSVTWPATIRSSKTKRPTLSACICGLNAYSANARPIQWKYCDSRRIHCDSPLEGGVLVSIETAEDQQQEEDIWVWLQDHFDHFLRLLRHLSKEDQELLLSYYLLGKTQSALASLIRYSCSSRERWRVS